MRKQYLLSDDFASSARDGRRRPRAIDVPVSYLMVTAQTASRRIDVNGCGRRPARTKLPRVGDQRDIELRNAALEHVRYRGVGEDAIAGTRSSPTSPSTRSSRSPTASWLALVPSPLPCRSGISPSGTIPAVGTSVPAIGVRAGAAPMVTRASA